MCVIITTPDRKHRPTLETLRLCAKHNRDGSGIAWIEGDRVHFIKGLSPEAIFETLAILTGPVVIHFRYATAGGKCPALCHPFPITAEAPAKEYGSSKAVLFHNGHWSGYEKFATENRLDLAGPVSDSRVAAVGAFLGGREFVRTLPGRYVIFSRAGLQRFGEWTEREGMHFSNLNWMPSNKLAAKPAAAPAKGLQSSQTPHLHRPEQISR